MVPLNKQFHTQTGFNKRNKQAITKQAQRLAVFWRIPTPRLYWLLLFPPHPELFNKTLRLRWDFPLSTRAYACSLAVPGSRFHVSDYKLRNSLMANLIGVLIIGWRETRVYLERTKTSMEGSNPFKLVCKRSVLFKQCYCVIISLILQETVSQLLKTHFKDSKTKSMCDGWCAWSYFITRVSIFLTVNNDAIKLSAEVLYVFILGKSELTNQCLVTENLMWVWCMLASKRGMLRVWKPGKMVRYKPTKSVDRFQ